MKQEYYYFVSGLPNITIEDTKLPWTPEEFLAEAKNQVSNKDYRLLEILHLPMDLDNLLRILYKSNKDRNKEGLYEDSFWEEYLVFLRNVIDNPEIKTPAEFEVLPEFIKEIVINALQQEELQPLPQTELALLKKFYAWTAKSSNEFIRDWFAFDAHIRNILTAINGRKFNLPYAQYLIGEGETLEKLSKSHTADFGLGKEDDLYNALVRIYEQNNILYRERGYDILRWRWVEDYNFFNYFNIDRILGYYCQLRILARWIKSSPELGKEVFNTILSDLNNSFSFPEDFNIKSTQRK
ncbi:MAG: hypothetical protein BWX76_00045 [Candidatus Cloacimonetes bacterium ADurb.Bin089]|nr:MAG: hypothetical protein BWX76_00045 [Candidatus Cloacimonetes bacterium ADurb.Bin089]